MKGRSFSNYIFVSPRRLLSTTSSTTGNEEKKNPKIFGKLILGTVLGTYGYYQWEHYNRNIELANKLDIPFYKVRFIYNYLFYYVFR